MKVQYVTANARLTFEFESENDKVLVTSLAHIQETFEESTCGCCKSDKIRFDVREFKGNLYYKLLCDECHATLDFGQHKAGNTLFVKRFVKDSHEPLANRGWYRYKNGAEKPALEAPPSKPSSAAPPAKPSFATPAPSTNHTTTKKATPATTPPRSGTAPADSHTKTLGGLRAATTASSADAWLAWGAKDPKRTPAQKREQETAHRLALERIAGLQIDDNNRK